MLQNFKAALQVDFLLNDVEKCVLNIVGEDIETTDTAGGAVKCNVSQNVVFAGKQKLEELWEAEFTITVRVEEFNKTLALNEAGAEVVVVF